MLSAMLSAMLSDTPPATYYAVYHTIYYTTLSATLSTILSTTQYAMLSATRIPGTDGERMGLPERPELIRALFPHQQSLSPFG
eukprot:3612029-Rhodomonas_salina.1